MTQMSGNRLAPSAGSATPSQLYAEKTKRIIGVERT
jgi:hypothetical protein